MAEIILTQAEADALISREKRRIDDKRWDYPGLGGSISIPLVSSDKRENFLLDIGRGKIDLLKGTYQNRCRQVIVLVRLDFGGQPHRNPDDEEISSPHLHIYRDGYGDKWAMPIPADKFVNVSNPWQTLEDFMRFCNIIEPPLIDRGLF
ncbi:MAG: hypothetical protein A3J24_03765 [Deltaproteobacteria bacterium RIFCSPLOWO2_02_FULL_53_8]|nr:MAG: hypothetical protein A3J24_03765 [Deltaproteobacteria bacterium RIFCSPLOWO2_02_FULL_53_8]